jgi:DNA-binding beta-propeller fold protein YncE
LDPALISGLSLPQGIAVSGGNLFVTSLNLTSDTGRIGKYATSGATVDPALITTLGGPSKIAVSGADLFVAVSNVRYPERRLTPR